MVLPVITTSSLLLLLLLSLQAGAVPVVEERPDCPSLELFAVSPDNCFLTPKLGFQGTRKFIEECESLGEMTKQYLFPSCGSTELRTFRQVHDSAEAPGWQFQHIRHTPRGLLSQSAEQLHLFPLRPLVSVLSTSRRSRLSGLSGL